jgi:hypothetical protein
MLRGRGYKTHYESVKNGEWRQELASSKCLNINGDERYCKVLACAEVMEIDNAEKQYVA